MNKVNLSTQYMEPENRITVDGKEYAKFSLAPYTLKKIGSEKTVTKRTRDMQTGGRSLKFAGHRDHLYTPPVSNKVMRTQSGRR